MTNDLEPHIQEVLANIHQRRSLPPQFMKPDPIDRETLALLFEAANWAPTHKLTEPWRFRVFCEDGRAKLAQTLGEVYTHAVGDRFDERKFIKTINRPINVPVVIAIVMAPGEKANLPIWEEILAVGCAMQNFHLAAHAMGIGCFWSTPGYLEHPQLREFLELNDRERCLGFFYMGYPKKAFPKSKRRPVNDKVTWVTA